MDINKLGKSYEKVWGKEIWVVNTDLYCMKYLVLNKKGRCSYHYHRIKDETFVIVSGKVLMETENNEFIMNPGDKIHITKTMLHRFTGLKDSVIIEVSTHHQENDSFRTIESYILKDKDFKELKKK